MATASIWQHFGLMPPGRRAAACSAPGRGPPSRRLRLGAIIQAFAFFRHPPARLPCAHASLPSGFLRLPRARLW
jgi:hypothetical protein